MKAAAATALAALALAGHAAAQNGQWDIIGESPVVCIHTIQLPNGKILCIERPRENPYAQNPDSQGRTVAEITIGGEGDPAITQSRSVIAAPALYENAFCGHHTQLGNGSILVTGGDQRELYQATNGSIMILEAGQQITDGGQKFLADGAKGRRLYNPCQPGDTGCTVGSWVQLPDMGLERWYPSTVTLGGDSGELAGWL